MAVALAATTFVFEAGALLSKPAVSAAYPLAA
jgi:hypothetical protein